MHKPVETLSSPRSYTRTAKILHWLVALFILTNVVLGLRMEYFPGFDHASPEWNGIFFWHGSARWCCGWLWRG
jgi:cytochrome b561